MANKSHPDDRYPDDTYLRVAEEDDARLQPDPELALSGGRATRWQIGMVALAIVLVTGLVLYGISQSPQDSETVAAPPAQTTGAAPSSGEPAASTSQGRQQGQQNEAPPEQPAREPAKQGPSDSVR
jgi:hypothetical protein